MRKALFVGVLLAALAYAAPAAAGCWSTVQLAPPPDGTKAGEAWAAEIKVFQHGRYPLPDAEDARPRVTITNAAGDSETFTAKPTDPSKGLYSAKVVFPSAGTWDYAVFDDFTSADGQPVPCARTHDVGSATIAKGARGVSTSGTSGLPIWPLAGAALLLVAAGVYYRRRRGLRATD
jgi:LPXTG-motif cell wall-anchored protein